MVIQTDMDSKRPNDQGRYLSKSAEQSSEPGCGLKTVTLLLLYIPKLQRLHRWGLGMEKKSSHILWWMWLLNHVRKGVQDILVAVYLNHFQGLQYCIRWRAGAPLLTWINFNPIMDKLDMTSKVCDGIHSPFPNFSNYTVQVWEWTNNHLTR